MTTKAMTAMITTEMISLLRPLSVVDTPRLLAPSVMGDEGGDEGGGGDAGGGEGTGVTRMATAGATCMTTLVPRRVSTALRKRAVLASVATRLGPTALLSKPMMVTSSTSVTLVGVTSTLLSSVGGESDAATAARTLR